MNKDSENVEHFLGHCLPESLDTLILSSSGVSTVKFPVEKYVESLSSDSALNRSSGAHFPAKKLAFWRFNISKEMGEAIVNLSSQLTQELFFGQCNIETRGLKFDPDLKFTLPCTKFHSCYAYNGDKSKLDGEVEDFVDAICNSQLKASLNKFWFTAGTNSFTKDEVKDVLKNKGLDDVKIEC